MMKKDDNNFIYRTKAFPIDVINLFSIFGNPNSVFTDYQIEDWNQQAKNIQSILDDLVDEANNFMEN